MLQVHNKVRCCWCSARRGFFPQKIATLYFSNTKYCDFCYFNIQNDQKVVCASRESNPVPWDPESEDQPTRLFRHQKMSSLRNLYASKIQNWWPHARRGFFRSKNSVSYIVRIQNLDFCVLKSQKHDFV